MIHRHAVTKKEKRFIDKAAYIVGILFPLSTIPQVVQLFVTKETAGLSIATWSAYLVLTSLFLVYAIVDQIKPLILTQVAWIVVDISMLVGIIIYH